MSITQILYDWTPDEMLEITLANPDAFLKVKETLTRIGIASKNDATKPHLYQSCHILHKQGKYFIVHFKELFALDGKPSSISIDDIERRNVIANLLQEWSLLVIVKLDKYKAVNKISQIKIVPYREKENWELVSKYSIGNSRTIGSNRT